MIGDISMFGLITYFVIVGDVDGGMVIAKYSSIGNPQIKFLSGVR
jgi:hypothetical protein